MGPRCTSCSTRSLVAARAADRPEKPNEINKPNQKDNPMTVQTVSHHTDGSASVSTGGTNSSINAPQGDGYQVRSGLHGRVTNDLSQVADNDLIVIDGMEITYAMAKDFGLIGAHVPTSGLSVGNAVPEAAPAAPSGFKTGHDGYDSTCAELNAQVSEGNLGFEEASEYQTALGQVALAGLTLSEASDTLDGIASYAGIWVMA